MPLFFDFDDGLTERWVKDHESVLTDQERKQLAQGVYYDDSKYYFSVISGVTRRLKGTIDKSGNWFFITVNTKPEIDLVQFCERLSKFATRKFIRYYYYNLEQRGETLDEVGKGVHSHLLINTLLTKSKVTQYLREGFVKFVGNVSNIHQLNVLPIPQAWVEDKKQYINGVKWDDTKTLKINIDKLFRENNNLKLYYSTEDAITIQP